MKRATIAKLLVVCLIAGMLCIPAGAAGTTITWDKNNTYNATANVNLGTYTISEGAYKLNLGTNRLTGGTITVEEKASLNVTYGTAKSATLFSVTGKAEVVVKGDTYYTGKDAYAINVSVTLLSKDAEFKCLAGTDAKVTNSDGGKTDNGYTTYKYYYKDSSGGNTSSGGGSGGGSSTTKKDTSITVKAEVNGTKASVTLSSTQANKLVNDAINNKSETVTVKVNAPDSATEVSATIPASALKKLADRTSAKLVIETPVASITLSNVALADLGSNSGNVTFTTAKGENNTVKIAVAKDGTELSSIKGGIVAAVPMKSATSGTVAVLVNADGTKTVIKKSVAKDGNMVVPLDGSATITFEDNSKSFADTNGHWSADALNFVTSRDLFQGTSDTTFEPDAKMNRAMLVTVLHRLENTPVGGTPVFGDVNSGEWYTEAVAWATSNGIVNGYDDGSFGPKNSVTREQIAVILYRYAEKQGLDTTQRGSLTGFNDGDATSSWAQDAMKWAVSVNLFQGKGDGKLDPKGDATRAEVAKLLMGFVTYMA